MLDPVFALRRRLRVPAGGTARIAFWTVVASSREALIDAIDKHQDTNAFERAATLAWTQAQVQLRHLDIAPAQASLYQRLAGHVLYANPSLRSPSDTIRRGLAGQPVLWAQGISGDVPIVLVRIDEVEDSGIVRELLRAREYWRLKGLVVDLVILNERGASYVQDLQIALETLVRTSRSRTHLGAESERGGIFVLRSDLIPAETRALLLAVARVVLLSRRGGLADQLNRLQTPRGVLPPARRKPATDAGPLEDPPPVAALAALQFFNGLGGFSPNGREYVTVLGPGQSTPAPWINVVSNPSFGFQVAAEGGGYTWSQNSRDNQLTPWSNDPVSDRPGEVLYVRDLDSGDLWTPTALPIRHEPAPYIVRHGRGYSRFEVVAHGIALELLQYVPLADPIKISRLTIRNVSDRPRRLSVTAFAEWVLGLSRGASAPTVVTERDAATGAIFARNPWNMHHGTRVAFADLGGRQTAWTADRSEFIGRNCTIDNPAALSAAIPLSQRVGAGLDPCAALQTTIELDRGATTEVVFFLGQAGDAAEAQALIERYRAADLNAVHREVTGYWEETLGAVQVKTPDRVHGHHAERLAALSDAGLPLLGAFGLLSGKRRLRLSRPAAGRHGAHGRAARDGARAHPARGGAAVRRGRLPALVVPARRPGRSHAHLRRPGVARHGRGALCRDHGRCGDPRRAGAVPRRPRPQAGRARSLLPAEPGRRDGVAVRALRARPRYQRSPPARTACR